MRRFLLLTGLLFIIGSLGACQRSKLSKEAVQKAPLPKEESMQQDIREIVLAGGCFWGVEAYFQRVPGILDTSVGYANGKDDETSYERLSQTDHAEAVRLHYDAHRIHLAEIFDRFFRIIDPRAVNRQGPDIGRQYRSGIYVSDAQSERIAKASLAYLASQLQENSAIALEPLRNFVEAESYHQDYLEKHPGGYCHISLAQASEPLYPVESLPSDAELKAKLSELAYHVLREQGTEAPGSSPLNHEQGLGIYLDRASGQALFSSLDKYDAGCGWPSFTKGLTTDVLFYAEDLRHGRERMEVLAKGSQGHLGHVFEDGPRAAGGRRYCINGAILRFLPKEKMAEEGYAAFLPYLVR